MSSMQQDATRRAEEVLATAEEGRSIARAKRRARV
jgi:hypothetical protein